MSNVIIHHGSIADIVIRQDKARVVTKQLRAEYIHIPVIRQRFLDEIEILSGLQQDFAPLLISTNTQSETPSFSYHYIDGQTIETLITEQSTSLDAIDITIKILERLDKLHNQAQPIIHSDIAPSNIIIDKESNVHLIDFGCARKVHPGDHKINGFFGQYAYLSPEQAQGRRWSVQSDLYQAGLIFYEMITNRRFNPGTSRKTKVPLAANPPRLNFINIKPSIQDCLYHMLAKHESDRFQSTAQALSELNNI